MKIVSLNMRGWGGSAKRRRLSLLIRKGAFDVCFIQETKKLSFENHLIHNLWGHKDVSWVAQEAEGLSGGMLIIWNSNSFKLLSNFSGVGYLGIQVEKENTVMYLVNIYSPCSVAGKKKLWDDLLTLKRQSGRGSGVSEEILMQFFILRKEREGVRIIEEEKELYLTVLWKSWR
jgi:exonuclease III